jgi:glyoxylase-like metal-dependent hydrolase (beta-lactamase superfamily II)
LGGVAKIFLTHRDDVADAAKYAKHFGAKRIIHEGDKSGMPDAEIFLEGMEPISMGRDFLIIPTPGHTRGHSVLLYKNKYLFSGDHLWWSRRTRHLGASRRHNWHSWKKQIDSIKRLQDYSFDWVLPGHGRRAHFPKEKMARELAELVEEMHA